MNLRLSIICSLLLLPGCTGRVTRSNSSGMENGEITAGTSQAVVTTSYGDVGGYIDNGLCIFKGIPYAKADRFMAPASPDKWDGVRSCRSYGPTAMQEERQGWYFDQMAFWFDWDDGYQGEDCQRINIWTPGVSNGKKRPVMVWLHGGGYSAGSGQELPSYDGSALARKGDVVIVTLNHRLNVLGFLDISTLGDKYSSSGNVGMLDIVAALEWINANIAAFGGDPSNVTIFGQSGGGGKVSTLMAMPSAKGLFHKAIVQSGSIDRTMDAKYSRRIGAATLQELGINAGQTDKLMTIPYVDLVEAGNKAIDKVRAEADKENGGAPFIFGWAPTVDGTILPSHPFSPEAPAISRDIPMIIGTTAHEFMNKTLMNPALQNITLENARKELQKEYGGKTDDFITAFAKAYPNYKPRDFFDTDLQFRSMAVRQGNLKNAQGGADVYMYLFTWESPVLDGMFRSMHCVELPFVFDNIGRCRNMTGGGAEAYELADKMSSAWINFARHGTPDAGGVPEWEAYDKARGATMQFGNKCTLLYNHDAELLKIAGN